MYRVNTVRKAINRNHWSGGGGDKAKKREGLTERKWMLNNEGGGAVMEA